MTDDTYGGGDYLMYAYCGATYDHEGDVYSVVLTNSIGNEVVGKYHVDLVNNYNTATGFDYHVTEQTSDDDVWHTIHESMVTEIEEITSHHDAIHVAAYSASQMFDSSIQSCLEDIIVDRFDSSFYAQSSSSEYKVGVKYVYNRDWGYPAFYVYLKGTSHDEYYDFEVFVKRNGDKWDVEVIENRDESW